MKGKVVGLAVAALLIVNLAGCKKKEETAPLPQQEVMPPITMPQQPSQVVIPETIKGKWTSVRIAIEDKAAKKTKDVTIKLNSAYRIPDSNLTLQIGEFLPDFKMEGPVITSVSDQPNNPAVKIIVLEGDKEIFKGWLYSKFPAIHPFQHEKYSLTLKEGIKG